MMTNEQVIQRDNDAKDVLKTINLCVTIDGLSTVRRNVEHFYHVYRTPRTIKDGYGNVITTPIRNKMDSALHEVDILITFMESS